MDFFPFAVLPHLTEWSVVEDVVVRVLLVRDDVIERCVARSYHYYGTRYNVSSVPASEKTVRS